MDAWIIFIAIFVVAVAIIIIASVKRKKSRKKPEKTVQSYIEYGDYVAAGRLHLQNNQQTLAADLYFQIPPEKRPAYESMILHKLGQQGAQLFWIKTGRRFERSEPEKARIAFMLANAFFDAVKMYVDKDDSVRAVEMLNHIPQSQREGTVRRLSQYAFNRAKYTIASDLLRSIGHKEEADAIMAVAAHEFGTIQRPQVAADIYDSVGRQDLAGASQERRGELALKEGRIEEAKVAFKKAIEAYDDSNNPKDALRIEERLKKFDLLDAFRDYVSNGNISAAENMLDEISDHFPGIAISDLYAEIASILEKKGDSTEAITYYDKAADSTNNPVKRQAYVNALRRIGTTIASQPSKGSKIASRDLGKCIVCNRPIKKGERFLTCPHCQKPAHYSHLIEYVKVTGMCPNCKARLRADNFQTE